MTPPHRLVVNIPENRKIEIELPGTLPVGPAEILVIPQHAEAQCDRASGMDAGRVWISEDFDAPLR